MGSTAVAWALILLVLVAGALSWTLLFRFEEFYPVAKDELSHRRRAGLFFQAVTGVTTVGILTVLVLAFQQLVNS